MRTAKTLIRLSCRGSFLGETGMSNSADPDDDLTAPPIGTV